MIYLLPFAVGFLIVFASIVNGQLAQKVGTTKGMQIHFLIGSLTALLMSIAFGLDSTGVPDFSKIPTIFLVGSFFGLGVVFLMNMIVPKISALYIVLLPFVGQMLVSGCIDYFYLNYLSKGKIIGALLILIGIMCNAILERTSATS